ncbi:hypothetical protein M378DRAFT_13837, partial [Amanita muscaria Koide BX008]
MSSSKTPTFGIHNPSPIKKRNVKKTNKFVVSSLHEARRAELFSKLQELHYHENSEPNDIILGREEPLEDNCARDSDVPEYPMDIDESENDQAHLDDHDGLVAMSDDADVPHDREATNRTKCVAPNTAS